MNLKSLLKNHLYATWVLVFWVIAAALLAACYCLLLQPIKQQLITVQNQYTESKDMLAVASMASRKDVQQRLQQHLNQVYQKVDQFSVSQEDTNGLVFEIGKLANELKLTEFSSKQQAPRDILILDKDATVSEAWLKVEFQSTFRQFAEFINSLERQTPAVFIERMTFSRNEENQKHDIRLELSFLVKQEQDESKVAQAGAAADNKKDIENLPIEN